MARVSRASVVRATKSRMKGRGRLPHARKLYGSAEREAELKARLRRARTPIVKPKGRLPNPLYGLYRNGELQRVIGRQGKHAAKMLTFHREYSPQYKWTIKALPSKQRIMFQDGRKQRKKNSFFGPEVSARAKRVTKTPPQIKDKETGERGEIIEVMPSGWLRVKWRNRVKQSFVRRDQISLARRNPGLLDLVYGKAAWDSVKGKRVGNPRSVNRTRRNPSIKEISEKFQGRVSNALTTMKASSSAPADLARIGKLVFLKVGKRNVRIPGSMVAADTRGRLWIAGNRAPLFNRAAKKGTALDYGEVAQICYETAKRHIGGGKTYEYVHSFGEEGGRKPHLLIDSDGMPILRGGDYKIQAEGIVN
jgi:hypothetical protein